MTTPPPRAARLTRRRLLVAAAAIAPAAASAQARFPQRPVTLIVPFAPGGIADLTARAVAQEMTRSLGQPVVVDNRPSAGGIVASQAVAKARPDGHTLLLMSNANAIGLSLFRKLPYDTLKDFAPVTTLAHFDLAVFVAAGSRWRSLGEVIAHAKAWPGRLNIGSIAVGSTQHLAAKLFENRAGIAGVVVPYKGTPAVLTALRAGDIDIAFEIAGPLLPQVDAGVLRMLALAAEQRHPALPQVPTVQQAGVAGYQVSSWNALAAPAGTPAAVIEQLGRAASAALAAPPVQMQLGALGVRLQAATPAQTQALLVAEARRWGEVIRAAKIEPE